MSNANLTRLHSHLHAPFIVDSDRFLIERQVPMVADYYHQCLNRCPKPLAFAMKVLGLSRDTITTNKIGFCDRSLPIQLPHHKSREGMKLRGAFERLGLLAGTGHELMRGCLTLPLYDDDGQVGMFGLRYDRPRRGVQPLKCSTFGHLPIYAPFLQGKVALMCDTPFTVLALREKGYQNGFSVLGTDVTEFTLSELQKRGTHTVVCFTDATSDFDAMDEMRSLIADHGLALCEMPLPFAVERFGKWDDYQWRLFDKRLTRTLHEQGLYNERYQA